MNNKKLAEMMEAALSRIAELGTSIRHREELLNSDRIDLSVNIFEWCRMAVDAELVSCVDKAYLTVCNKTGLSKVSVGRYHNIGRYIVETNADRSVVKWGAIYKLNSHVNTIENATKLKADSAIKKGATRYDIVKLIGRDKMAVKSMAQGRAKKAAREGRMHKDQLRIEMMALQTMAQQFFGQDCIVSITDIKFVPLLTVGARKTQLA